MFSRRHETRRPDEGLLYERVPDRVVPGLLYILDRIVPDLDRPQLAKAVYELMDIPYPASSSEYRRDYLPRLLGDANRDDLCDACEAIWRWLASAPHRSEDQFSNEVNELFVRHYFGYELRDGRVERVGANVQEEPIAEARAILRDPELSGPDKQFQKALAFYNRRPEPDCENCVKEAVGAVEALARVLLQDDSLLLSAAAKRLQKEKGVNPNLLRLISDLYAYRGDAKGVAHGLTAKEVGLAEAEFVLSASANAIVYLARLYGRRVE